jgi:hypothetical protein
VRCPLPPVSPVSTVSALLAMVALVVLAGCKPRPAIRHERGASGEAPAAAAPAAMWRLAGREDLSGSRGEGEQVTVTETPVPDPEPEPDVEAMVRNAYGYPAECLSRESFLPNASGARIRLSVSLTTTGLVTRASVSASGLTAAAQQCLQARADRLRVPGPIPDAPRTVYATLEVNAPPPVAVVEEPPQQYELPPGAQQPGQTLPAIVGDGPAPGARPPGVVLPAVVGSGPAEGSRPADRELPARGGSGTWMWISGSAEGRGEVPDDWNDD